MKRKLSFLLLNLIIIFAISCDNMIVKQGSVYIGDGDDESEYKVVAYGIVDEGNLGSLLQICLFSGANMLTSTYNCLAYSSAFSISNPCRAATAIPANKK